MHDADPEDADGIQSGASDLLDECDRKQRRAVCRESPQTRRLFTLTTIASNTIGAVWNCVFKRPVTADT